ncbi:DinB family protein [Rummeliibacillus sp. TYF005]|uniref:DinB family protein n=1 Tax=Rummeliibacillus sp. TYF005 TaxID=2058214 RepID=UPI000F5297FC|nr:DinB family protein [Rummeliibacillus sp. TYF005]RPJ95361.1 DinB family protein [Rummeliibacillus sp. TYF005]
MEFYVQKTLYQIQFIVNSINELFSHVETKDLKFCPVEGKRNLGQLCSHLSLICSADLQILQESSLEEMDVFYSKNVAYTKEEWSIALKQGYKDLKNYYSSIDDLTEETSSYWGTTYSYFEWLLEILVHLQHHRAQLHQYLLLLKGNVKVTLFE